jgi:Leucine-rich repeat (LRR) protein
MMNLGHSDPAVLDLKLPQPKSLMKGYLFICKIFPIVFSLLFFLSQNVQAQKSGKQKSSKKTEIKKTSKKTPVQKSNTQQPAKKTSGQNPKEKPAKIEKPVGGSSPDAAQDEKNVRDIVAFLEYMLNTIGSSSTASRDKDIMVTESYSKIFRDAKVQVEDDLDEERDVITNKDVVAYLKDVDFFFNDVKFEFTVEEIKRNTMPNGQLFYKVSMTRHLTGTTPEGKQVNNTMPRYIEINYNPQDQDLKIVSIYTNQFNEKEALTAWWKDLSYEWKEIFKRNLPGALHGDSVQLEDIKNITAIEHLDISSNQYIQNLSPLAQLPSLKLLNLSGTNVNDLTPIRNLTELAELNLSHTKIHDLSPLKYSIKLLRLNIDHTLVSDISVVEKMPDLQNFDMSVTPVLDFTPLSNLVKLFNLNLRGTQISNLSYVEKLIELTDLNVSTTPVRDAGPLKVLKNLSMLTIDSTGIRDITPLNTLQNLKVLHANFTLISDLQPLQKLPGIEKIYCDHTSITRDKADAFMSVRPNVLVIFDSKDLKAWWETLPQEWKEVLSSSARIAQNPTKEELAKVTNIDSINFQSNTPIRDLEPLRKLQKLKVIIASKTSVTDLSPLREHTDIRYLDISETEVSDLSVVNKFGKLKVLQADGSKIQDLASLSGLKSLEKLYADHTAIVDVNAREFLEKNPRCLLIYKTVHLNRWWHSLSEEWKKVLRTQMETDTISTRENLHKLAERRKLNFKDAALSDLSALTEFVILEELDFSGTSITNITPLENLRSIKSLHATSSPIQQIGSLSQFADLEDLDISNTPVDDLKPISNLQKLKRFNCAGTQIKKVDSLENLQKLESLDCSNTRVNKIDPLIHLELKVLKCYNTKISEREIKNFKERNPDCNVVYYR